MEMVQRLTITIPDNLHERLQTIKERLNVSRVCQSALDLAIQIEEIKDRTDISMVEKAIARLQKQKQEAAAKWKQTGFNDGLKDATEKLSYKVLKYVGSGGDIHKETPGMTYEPPIIMSLEDRYEDMADFEFKIYVDGWVEGVIHLWEEIKDKL